MPSASGAKRAATAAPDPPDDPPGVLSRFHGLRVTPVNGESVEPFQPNSGVVVLPIKIAPTSFSRATVGASSSHGPYRSTVLEPRKVGQFFVSNKSLIATGTPSSGDSASPAIQRASASSAFCCTACVSTKQNALVRESSASIRPRQLSTTSTGERSLAANAVDNSAAVISCGSCIGIPQSKSVIPGRALHQQCEGKGTQVVLKRAVGHNTNHKLRPDGLAINQWHHLGSLPSPRAARFAGNDNVF